MDMLVLFPLEFLANFPTSKPVMSVLKGTDVEGVKKGQLLAPKLEDVDGDVVMKAHHLRLETSAAPASMGSH